MAENGQIRFNAVIEKKTDDKLSLISKAHYRSKSNMVVALIHEEYIKLVKEGKIKDDSVVLIAKDLMD